MFIRPHCFIKYVACHFDLQKAFEFASSSNFAKKMLFENIKQRIEKPVSWKALFTNTFVINGERVPCEKEQEPLSELLIARIMWACVENEYKGEMDHFGMKTLLTDEEIQRYLKWAEPIDNAGLLQLAGVCNIDTSPEEPSQVPLNVVFQFVIVRPQQDE